MVDDVLVSFVLYLFSTFLHGGLNVSLFIKFCLFYLLFIFICFAKFLTVADVGNCCWFVIPGGRRSAGWRRVAEGSWYSSWTDGAVVSISAA